MAIATTCKTPGAIYTTHIVSNGVSISVGLPFPLDITRKQAADLENTIHNQLELALAPYFKRFWETP